MLYTHTYIEISCSPPSTRIISPVIHAALSDKINSATFAISSGVVSLPEGLRSIALFTNLVTLGKTFIAATVMYNIFHWY